MQNEYLRGQESYNVRVCYIRLAHVEIFLNGGSQLEPRSSAFNFANYFEQKGVTYQWWKSEP
jgi:hypothetical protein